MELTCLLLAVYDATQSNSHLSNLCTRLDYNGFYTKG